MTYIMTEIYFSQLYSLEVQDQHGGVRVPFQVRVLFASLHGRRGKEFLRDILIRTVPS